LFAKKSPALPEPSFRVIRHLLVQRGGSRRP